MLNSISVSLPFDDFVFYYWLHFIHLIAATLICGDS